jgi:hypothetical protein
MVQTGLYADFFYYYFKRYKTHMKLSRSCFQPNRRKEMNRLVCSLWAGESKLVLPTTSEVA